MNLEEAIEKKKTELTEMQKDVDSLEAQASQLRETVKKYNSLKRESSKIKKAMSVKENEFNTVINFFNSIDDNYLREKYPLFEQLIIQAGDQPAAAQQLN